MRCGKPLCEVADSLARSLMNWSGQIGRPIILPCCESLAADRARNVLPKYWCS